MVCEIKILLVKGYESEDGVLHTIHVEGEIVDPVADQDRQIIILGHDCYKGEENISIEVAAAGAVAAGTWEGDIPYIGEKNGCDCGEFIQIRASHRTDDGRELCENDNWEGLLECELRPLCPSPVHISAMIGDCINGKRQVTLEARIYPADSSAISSYKWEFFDAADNEIDIECTVNTTTSWQCGTSGTSTEELTIISPNGTEVIEDYLVQTTGQILIPAPGNDDVKIKITFTVVGNTAGCSNTLPYSFTITGCGASCPTITYIEVGDGECNDNLTKRLMFFIPHVDGAGVTEHIWDYGDGTIDNIGEHWYDVGTTQTVKLTINGPGSCSHTLDKTFFVKKCPVNDKKNGKKNGFDWGKATCCALIYTWLAGFLLGMTAWKLNFSWFWIPLAIAGGLITIWLIRQCCCKVKWSDILLPWRLIKKSILCCSFLRWHILAHVIFLVIITPLLAGGMGAVLTGISSSIPIIGPYLQWVYSEVFVVLEDGTTAIELNWWVDFVVGVGLVFFTTLYYQVGCKKAKPDPYNVKTWPKCKCK